MPSLLSKYRKKRESQKPGENTDPSGTPSDRSGHRQASSNSSFESSGTSNTQPAPLPAAASTMAPGLVAGLPSGQLRNPLGSNVPSASQAIDSVTGAVPGAASLRDNAQTAVGVASNQTKQLGGQLGGYASALNPGRFAGMAGSPGGGAGAGAATGAAPGASTGASLGGAPQSSMGSPQTQTQPQAASRSQDSYPTPPAHRNAAGFSTPQHATYQGSPQMQSSHHMDMTPGGSFHPVSPSRNQQLDPSNAGSPSRGMPQRSGSGSSSGPGSGASQAARADRLREHDRTFQQRYRQTADSPQDTQQYLDLPPSENPWAESQIRRAVPSARFGHSANYIAARDGELFIMGGIRDMDILEDLWVIDTHMLTGYQLRTEGPRVGPRVGHAALTLGNAYIMFGGDTKIKESDPLDDNLYLLNTTTLKWTVAEPVGPRPAGRYGHSLANIGVKVYVFGGQVDDMFFDDMWVFDLTTLRSASSRWEKVHPSSPPPPPRTNHTVVTYQDKVYLFGGANGDLWYSDTWCFDPADLSWTQLDCSGYVPAPCQGHAATIIGDVMYVFGGMSSEGLLIDQLFALKLTTLKWYTFQNLGPGPSRRSGHSLTAFDGDKILVWGGTDENNTAFVLDVSRINYPPDSVENSPGPSSPTSAPRPDLNRSADLSNGGEPLSRASQSFDGPAAQTTSAQPRDTTERSTPAARNSVLFANRASWSPQKADYNYAASSDSGTVESSDDKYASAMDLNAMTKSNSGQIEEHNIGAGESRATLQTDGRGDLGSGDETPTLSSVNASAGIQNPQSPGLPQVVAPPQVPVHGNSENYAAAGLGAVAGLSAGAAAATASSFGKKTPEVKGGLLADPLDSTRDASGRLGPSPRTSAVVSDSGPSFYGSAEPQPRMPDGQSGAPASHAFSDGAPVLSQPQYDARFDSPSSDYTHAETPAVSGMHPIEKAAQLDPASAYKTAIGEDDQLNVGPLRARDSNKNEIILSQGPQTQIIPPESSPLSQETDLGSSSSRGINIPVSGVNERDQPSSPSAIGAAGAAVAGAVGAVAAGATSLFSRGNKQNNVEDVQNSGAFDSVRPLAESTPASSRQVSAANPQPQLPSQSQQELPDSMPGAWQDNSFSTDADLDRSAGGFRGPESVVDPSAHLATSGPTNTFSGPSATKRSPAFGGLEQKDPEELPGALSGSNSNSQKRGSRELTAVHNMRKSVASSSGKPLPANEEDLASSLAKLQEEFTAVQEELRSQALESANRIDVLEKERDAAHTKLAAVGAAGGIAGAGTGVVASRSLDPRGDGVTASGPDVGPGPGFGSSADHTEEVRQLRERLAHYEQKDLDSDHHALKQSHAVLQRDLVSTRDAHEQAKRERDLLEQDHGDLSTRYESLNRTVDDNVNGLSAANEALAATRQRLETASARAEELEKLNSQLRKDLAATTEKHASVESTVAELKSRNDYLEKEALELRDVADKSSAALTNHISKVYDTWNTSLVKSPDVSTSNRSLDGSINAHPDIAHYQNLYEFHKNAYEKANKDLTGAFDENARLREQLRSHTESTLQAPKQADLDELAKKHEATQRELADQHARTQNEFAQFKALHEDKVSEWQQKHDSLETDLKGQLAGLKEKHSALENEYNGSLDYFRNQRIALEKSREELSKQKEQNQRLENQLAEARLQSPSGDANTSAASGSKFSTQAELMMRDLKAQVYILQEERDELREKLEKAKRAALTANPPI